MRLGNVYLGSGGMNAGKRGILGWSKSTRGGKCL